MLLFQKLESSVQVEIRVIRIKINNLNLPQSPLALINSDTFIPNNLKYIYQCRQISKIALIMWKHIKEGCLQAQAVIHKSAPLASWRICSCHFHS